MADSSGKYFSPARFQNTTSHAAAATARPIAQRVNREGFADCAVSRVPGVATFWLIPTGQSRSGCMHSTPGTVMVQAFPQEAGEIARPLPYNSLYVVCRTGGVHGISRHRSTFESLPDPHPNRAGDDGLQPVTID